MNNISFFLPIISSVALVTIMYMIPEIKIIAIANLLSMILLIYFIYKKQRKAITPLLLVTASLYIFHAGHLWIALFKENSCDYIMGFGYSSSEYELVHIYRMLTNMLILFGSIGVFFVKEYKKNNVSLFFFTPKGFHFIIIILYIVMMFFEFQRALKVSATSYGEGYHYSNTFAIILADWIDILLYAMMFASKDNPKLFWRYFGLLLFRALFIMFFVGNRGSSVIQIITAVFIISHFSYLSEDRAKLKRIIIGIALFLFVSLPLISLVRSGISSGDVFSEHGPIEAFLTEFGDTARNTFLVDGYINNMGTANGLQMLFTSLTIFPMSTIFFGEQINHYGMIGYFLNDYYNIKGLGGSMFAQLYFNFGDTIWLYVFTILIALFVTKISNSLMTKNNSLYKTLILIGLFVGIMANVRGELYSTMSSLKVSLYLCLFIYLFLGKNIVKK